MSKTLNRDMDELQEMLVRLTRALRPRLWPAVITRAGITLDQPAATLLHFLVSCPESKRRPHALAERMSVEAPFITRKIQQLEDMGLVERHEDPADRRAYTLKPTALGLKVSKRLHEAKRETMAEILAGWSSTDRKQLIILLAKLADDTEAFHKQTKQTVIQK